MQTFGKTYSGQQDEAACCAPVHAAGWLAVWPSDSLARFSVWAACWPACGFRGRVGKRYQQQPWYHGILPAKISEPHET
jgi:hypothetical protein